MDSRCPRAVRNGVALVLAWSFVGVGRPSDAAPRVRGNLECDMVWQDSCGAPLPRSTASRWHGNLLQSELSFLGTYLSRRPIGPRQWVVRCAVIRVFAGDPDTAVVSFRTMIEFSDRCLKPGDPVLVTLVKNVDRDSLKLAGGYYRIGHKGELLSYFQNNCDAEDLQLDHRRLRLRDLGLRGHTPIQPE